MRVFLKDRKHISITETKVPGNDDLSVFLAIPVLKRGRLSVLVQVIREPYKRDILDYKTGKDIINFIYKWYKELDQKIHFEYPLDLQIRIFSEVESEGLENNLKKYCESRSNSKINLELIQVVDYFME